MENENEDFTSSNEELYKIDEIDDVDVVKEKFQKLIEHDSKVTEANRHLFPRLKKAEGFELKDGRWIKTEPKLEVKPEVKPEKSDELNYGHLAFLTSKGIEEDEDIDFVKGIAKRTGEELRDVLKDEFVQNKLKVLKEARDAKNAVPSGTRRSAPTAKDEVSYWLEKGELPPDLPENRKIRQDVVNAKIAKDKLIIR
jgi:hypothetical protein